jgi:hypothetical protein
VFVEGNMQGDKALQAQIREMLILASSRPNVLMNFCTVDMQNWTDSEALVHKLVRTENSNQTEYPIPSIIRKLDNKKTSVSRECQVMIIDHLTPYEYGGRLC